MAIFQGNYRWKLLKVTDFFKKFSFWNWGRIGSILSSCRPKIRASVPKMRIKLILLSFSWNQFARFFRFICLKIEDHEKAKVYICFYRKFTYGSNQRKCSQIGPEKYSFVFFLQDQFPISLKNLVKTCVGT